MGVYILYSQDTESIFETLFADIELLYLITEYALEIGDYGFLVEVLSYIYNLDFSYNAS